MVMILNNHNKIFMICQNLKRNYMINKTYFLMILRGQHILIFFDIYIC